MKNYVYIHIFHHQADFQTLKCPLIQKVSSVSQVASFALAEIESGALTVMGAKDLWNLLSFTSWAVNQPPPEHSKLPLNSVPFIVFFDIIQFTSGLYPTAPSCLLLEGCFPQTIECSL